MFRPWGTRRLNRADESDEETHPQRKMYLTRSRSRDFDRRPVRQNTSESSKSRIYSSRLKRKNTHGKDGYDDNEIEPWNG